MFLRQIQVFLLASRNILYLRTIEFFAVFHIVFFNEYANETLYFTFQLMKKKSNYLVDKSQFFVLKCVDHILKIPELKNIPNVYNLQNECNCTL
jgi:hypothetical protein